MNSHLHSKLIKLIFISLSLLTSLLYPFTVKAELRETKTLAKKEIIVIVPMQHTAMNEIVDGLKEGLKEENVYLNVKNAHGDMTLMRGIITQHSNRDAIFAPIGTATAQMTMANIKSKPIVCIAATLPQERNELIVAINDEVEATRVLTLLPKIKKIAVLYSGSEKTLPEIENLKKYSSVNKITLYPLLATNLTELPLLIKNSPKDIQAFLLLKDHIIVSGVNAIIQEADIRKIPIIASDEGSVKNGATLALAVREKELGINAATIIKSILSGTKISEIAPPEIKDIILFVNRAALSKQSLVNIEYINGLNVKTVEF